MWTRFFSTYIVGPVAAVLPDAWRKALPLAGGLQWERAAAVSGTLEIATGIVGMGYWYMHAMAPMIAGGTEWALRGKFGQEVTDHQIAGAALIVFATHPTTWMLAYVFGEGAVRLFAAAFTEEVLGSFPLYLLERAIFLTTRRKEARPAEAVRSNLASIADTVRERAMVARHKEVPDELRHSRDGSEDILEISASRRKVDWVAPKTVRVDETYYRLEDSSRESGPRPFRYRLRRLAAGVPGRSVLLYRSPRQDNEKSNIE
jgi:hypothetical protein